MKKLVLALSAITAFAAAQASAETVITDADENGTYSVEELRAAFPDLTDEAFAAADTNQDGQIDAEELAAAREAGTIPA